MPADKGAPQAKNFRFSALFLLSFMRPHWPLATMRAHQNRYLGFTPCGSQSQGIHHGDSIRRGHHRVHATHLDRCVVDNGVQASRGSACWQTPHLFDLGAADRWMRHAQPGIARGSVLRR